MSDTAKLLNLEGIHPEVAWVLQTALHPVTPPAKILVIEDDPGIFAVLEYCARKFNVELTFAPTGELGLKKLRDGGWNLVVLDMCLPDVLGTEVFRQMQEFDSRTPVVAISGQLDITAAVNALAKIGFAPFIKKPEHFNEAFISSLLRHHQFTEKHQ